LQAWKPGAVDLSTAITEFTKAKDAIAEIKFGDEIDEETFKALGEGAE
jgi:hypothetical protein